ncbi:MAG: hypothetical protein ACI4RB_02100 [Acutalibacteraceae bacterium]
MKKSAKKFISVLLSLCIVLSISVVAFASGASDEKSYIETDSVESAAQALADNDADRYPLVIVPGINHSPVYLCDENNEVIYDENGDTVNGTLLIVNTDNLIPIVLRYVAVPLIMMLITQRDCGLCNGIQKVVDSVFSTQTTNPDGSLVNNLQLKDFHFPLSEFDENSFDGRYDKAWFYRMLPIQKYTEVAGEDEVYLYTFNLMGNVMDSADGLDEFIQYVKKETGKDKVNLLNVSLGGTVFTAYMDRYVDKGDVDEIVNVVAVLNGTGIIGDFFARDWNLSDESLYRDIFPYIMGAEGNETLGYAINLLIRFLPRHELESILTAAYDRLFEDLLHNTSQFWAMVPSEYYPELADRYLSDEAHAQLRKSTDEFYHAQLNLVDNVKKFKAQGGEMNNLCGYGLQFGEQEYSFFALVASYDKVNSDGVIQIESTSLGATAAPAGQKLSDEYVNSLSDKSYLSPDGSLDASTCAFPDNVWFFTNQHHEIGGNDVALRLASEILLDDEIKDIHSNPEKWPQFNGSRNTKWVTRSYLKDAAAVDMSTLTQAQADELTAAVAEANAMLERTIIDVEGDAATVQRLYDALVLAGVYEAKEEETLLSQVLYYTAKAANNLAFNIVGAKGYFD